MTKRTNTRFGRLTSGHVELSKEKKKKMMMTSECAVVLIRGEGQRDSSVYIPICSLINSFAPKQV